MSGHGLSSLPEFKSENVQAREVVPMLSASLSAESETHTVKGQRIRYIHIRQYIPDVAVGLIDDIRLVDPYDNGPYVPKREDSVKDGYSEAELTHLVLNLPGVICKAPIHRTRLT